MKHERDVYKDPSKLEARYANYFEIGHRLCEFVIDFGQFYSEEGEERLHTRIVTTPACAENLLQVLRASLEKYEQIFGRIEEESEE